MYSNIAGYASKTCSGRILHPKEAANAIANQQDYFIYRQKYLSNAIHMS